MFRLRLLKVATPFTAATVVVPASVAPPGLVPIATVTVAVDEVTVLPEESWIATRTAGLMVAPALMVLGCWMNATRLA